MTLNDLMAIISRYFAELSSFRGHAPNDSPDNSRTSSMSVECRVSAVAVIDSTVMTSHRLHRLHRWNLPVQLDVAPTTATTPTGMGGDRYSKI